MDLPRGAVLYIDLFGLAGISSEEAYIGLLYIVNDDDDLLCLASALSGILGNNVTWHTPFKKKQ